MRDMRPLPALPSCNGHSFASDDLRCECGAVWDRWREPRPCPMRDTGPAWRRYQWFLARARGVMPAVIGAACRVRQDAVQSAVYDVGRALGIRRTVFADMDRTRAKWAREKLERERAERRRLRAEAKAAKEAAANA